MRDDERQALRRRFDFRCAFCGVHERAVGAELTVDHFQPRSKGGADDVGNWVYCCHACNEFKGDFWHPDSPCRILHPLREELASHLTEDSDGRLRALTDIGAFHIERLHLNRDPLVEGRRERRQNEVLRRADAFERERLRKLLERLRRVIAKIGDSHSG
jgi:hypothetical protein